MSRALPYYGALTMPVLVMLGLLLGGWWGYSMLVVPFVVVPIIDHLVGPDTRQPDRSELKDLESQISYRMVLYIYAALQCGLLVWAMLQWPELQGWERWACTIVMGVMTGGLGITIAHELVHRSSWVERALGYGLLCSVWYGHFGVEHVRGHHKNVGLRIDPATARRGEHAYAFVVRSLVMGFVDAFRIEPRLVAGLTIVQAGWTVLAVVLVGDLSVLWFVLGQSAVAVLLLELVNYVEHYGLVRHEVAPGVMAKFSAQHAWESRYPASNYLLFKLQRHADHHMHPQRRYQTLRVHEDSPQLPSGYPMMVLLALVPSLWFRAIDRRIPAM
ncbi:MAG: alkane 1-monooxygenase [Candidatus Kapaibacteriota bacterium]